MRWNHQRTAIWLKAQPMNMWQIKRLCATCLPIIGMLVISLRGTCLAPNESATNHYDSQQADEKR
jgi:hypothetical protein